MMKSLTNRRKNQENWTFYYNSFKNRYKISISSPHTTFLITPLIILCWLSSQGMSNRFPASMNVRFSFTVPSPFAFLSIQSQNNTERTLMKNHIICSIGWQ